jgi:hypothetical protein
MKIIFYTFAAIGASLFVAALIFNYLREDGYDGDDDC